MGNVEPPRQRRRGGAPRRKRRSAGGAGKRRSAGGAGRRNRGDRDHQSRHRADGEDLRRDERSGRRALPGGRGRGARRLPPDQLRRTSRVDAQRGRDPGFRAGPDRGHDDHRDGQDAGRRPAGSGQVRHCLPLLRRARRRVPRRRARRLRCRRRENRLRRLSPARPGPGHHALELPALAGDALRRARPDGRQRRAAQARLERAADGAVHPGPVRPGRVPPGNLPDPARGLRPGRGDPARPPGDGRDAHRVRGLPDPR